MRAVLRLRQVSLFAPLLTSRSLQSVSVAQVRARERRECLGRAVCGRGWRRARRWAQAQGGLEALQRRRGRRRECFASRSCIRLRTPLAHTTPRSTPLCAPAQWYENTEGEVRNEKERSRQRPCRPLNCLPPLPLSQSSWTPPFADDDETPAYETDGPGGARLKDGWKRCSDDDGDVWCVFFFSAPSLALRPVINPALAPFHLCCAGTSTRTARVPGTRPCTMRTDTFRLRDEMHAHHSRPLASRASFPPSSSARAPQPCRPRRQ